MFAGQLRVEERIEKAFGMVKDKKLLNSSELLVGTSERLLQPLLQGLGYSLLG